MKTVLTSSRVVTLCSFFLLSLLTVLGPLSTSAEVFYVAPDGDDSAAGTLESPWASLGGARDNIRPLLNGQGDITVYLRGGTFVFAETVVLGTGDSGSENQSITYAAYPGETPIFSSLVKVDGWSTHSGDIMQADLPAGVDHVRYLHDDSETWLKRSSTAFFRPDFLSPYGGPEAEHWEPDAQLRKTFTIYPTSFSIPDPTKAAQLDLRVHMTAWHAQVLPVSGIDTGSRRIDVATPSHYSLVNGLDDIQTEVWLLNSIEGIDQPGEWACLDGKIYLYPASGTSDIFVPRLEELIRVDAGGDGNTWAGTPVQNIHFEGITFTGTDYRISEADDVMAQHDWQMVDVPEGLLRFRNAANCTVTRCVFTKAGSDAVRLDRYAQNIVIDSCQFSYLGKGGVLMSGRGPGYGDVNKSNTVVNSHFNQTSRIKWDAAPVHLDQSSSNLIKNSYFEDVPLSAIIVSGNRESNIAEIEGEPINRDFHFKEVRPDLVSDWEGSSTEFYDHDNIVEENTFRAVHVGTPELIPAVSSEAPGFTNGMIYTTGRKAGATDTFRKNYFFDVNALPTYSHTWVILGDGHEDYLDFHQNMAYNLNQIGGFEDPPFMSNNCNLSGGCRATANVKLNSPYSEMECSVCENPSYSGNVDFDSGSPSGSASNIAEYQEMWTLLCPGGLPGPVPLPGASELQTNLAALINRLGGTVPTCSEDVDPPDPDPSTWASDPTTAGANSIRMTATVAVDSSGVEYSFDETTGNPGGSDSGWQESPSYTDTGLTAATNYCYRVTARDNSSGHNETASSTQLCVTTSETNDSSPPTPDPMTWSTPPQAITPDAVSMTATTASDPAGVQYFFSETTGNPGGSDSGWQASASWTDAGLEPETSYSYTVKARDLSASHNQTAPSVVASVVTPAGDFIVVPAVAHVEGAAGTRWRSDVAIHNASGASVGITVSLLAEHATGSARPTSTFTVPARSSLELADVVAAELATSGSGALLVASTSSGLLVSSRTFNDLSAEGSGTYGQYIPGFSSSDALGAGEVARIIQLRGSQAYRTNLGLVNLGPSSTVITLDLFDGAGVLLDTLQQTLEPWSYTALFDVFSGHTDVDSGFAEITSATASARYMAWASVVDNTSGDPVFLPARR